MKVASSFAVLALSSLGSSFAIDLTRRDSALKVQLSLVSNTGIKASVTNAGDVGLNLLKRGTILDDDAVEKVDVYSSGQKVQFKGVRYRVATVDLPDTAFTFIPANGTVDTVFDIASVNDLSAGGSYSLVAHGAIPFADAGSSILNGRALPYRSNVLDITVDGAAAAAVAKFVNPLRLRTDFQNDCSGQRKDDAIAAAARCKNLANAAAEAAESGDESKFQEYFRTTSSSARQTVAARFRAVRDECHHYRHGATVTYCEDVYNSCQNGVLAYTLPSENIVVNCPLYYTYLPVLTDTCHAQDMSTTTLHEMTHADGVYSPGTADNAYGYDASIQLSSDEAILNADTYALYANAIYVGC